MATNIDWFRVPLAYNGRASDFLYQERKFYKEDVYPKWGPRPIDMWYEKPYYGKVDIYGNPVYPSESYLKQLKGKDQWALSFVADAFHDFRQFILKGNNKNKGTLSSMLGPMVPVRSWINKESLYDAYFKDVIYSNFVNGYISLKGAKIKNFKEFIKAFIEYCSIIVNKSPVTKTAFITSNMCPNHISGMIIDLFRQDNGDDYLKFQQYITNPNFNKYRQYASNFGFFVDKNAPWRLVVNLASDATKRYMQRMEDKLIANKEGETKSIYVTLENNNLFKKPLFYRSGEYDYASLIVYLYDSYRTYVDESPCLSEYSNIGTKKIYINSFTTSTSNIIPTIQKVTKRERLSTNSDPKKAFAEFKKIYDDNFFLDVYFKIRLLESKMELRENAYNVQYKKVAAIAKQMGTVKAVKYINNYTKQTRIYEKPTPFDPIPYQLKYLGKKHISGLAFLREDDILLSIGQSTTSYGTATSY